MAEIGCGNLAELADYGFPNDCSEDYTPTDFQESLEKYKKFMHAAHGMIFTRFEGLLWDLFPRRGTALMQMRFDGNIGFPGGLLDKADELPVEALNREMAEEIELNLEEFSFTQTHHCITHVNHSKELVTHFYLMEVNNEQYESIEKNSLNAKDWGTETLGVIRVPLSVLGDGFRGFPVFLANRFAGNAKEQLLYSIRKSNLVQEEDLRKMIKAHKEYVETMKRNDKEDSTNDLVDIDMDHYASNSCSDYSIIDVEDFKQYDSFTKASHAMIYTARADGTWEILMHMRFDGFIGFPGGLTDQGETVEESLTRELHEEIGWPRDKMITSDQRFVSHVNVKTKLSLHFYCCQVSDVQMSRLRTELINADEYGVEVLGPIQLTPKTDLNKFLLNAFIGNTKDQLICALQKLLLNSKL